MEDASPTLLVAGRWWRSRKHVTYSLQLHLPRKHLRNVCISASLDHNRSALRATSDETRVPALSSVRVQA